MEESLLGSGIREQEIIGNQTASAWLPGGEIKFSCPDAARGSPAQPFYQPEKIVTAMATELRKPGISLLGDLPWGTHFCHFYETKEDLLHAVVPYFKAGLESNECCVWVVSEPVSEEEARDALR